jgi:hypothetical protein
MVSKFEIVETKLWQQSHTYQRSSLLKFLFPNPQGCELHPIGKEGATVSPEPGFTQLNTMKRYVFHSIISMPTSNKYTYCLQGHFDFAVKSPEHSFSRYMCTTVRLVYVSHVLISDTAVFFVYVVAKKIWSRKFPFYIQISRSHFQGACMYRFISYSCLMCQFQTQQYIF